MEKETGNGFPTGGLCNRASGPGAYELLVDSLRPEPAKEQAPSQEASSQHRRGEQHPGGGMGSAPPQAAGLLPTTTLAALGRAARRLGETYPSPI